MSRNSITACWHSSTTGPLVRMPMFSATGLAQAMTGRAAHSIGW